MTQAQAFALLVRRITLNRQGTEAQVFLRTPLYPFLSFRSLSPNEMTPTGGLFRGPHPGASQGGVVLGEGFLYLRSDGFAHFAQGLGAEEVAGFALGKGRVELRFQDGSALALRYRLGRWVRVLHFS